MKHRYFPRLIAMAMALMMICISASVFAEEARNTKREFKDLIIYEPYEYLNSEITGDYDEAHAVKCVNGTFVGTGGRAPLQGTGVRGRERPGL